MKRYDWIDLLRGLAVVGMVWTHSANTFLEASLQDTAGYHELSYYHGLIAPIFFWVAGYMRGLAAAKTGPQKPAWPTVKRLLIILLIGYLGHAPWGALMQGDFSAATLRVLFMSDVLHCLAVSCLLLLGLERLMPSPRSRVVAVTVLGLLVVLVTPFMQTATTGFIPLDAFLSRQHGSLFPLFPWVGFACAGFIVGALGGMSWWLALAGAVAGYGLPWIPGPSGTASFFCERLGWVTLVAVIVMKSCELLQTKGWGLPRWLLLAGRESLVVYVAHLLMIHAVPWWHGTSLDRLVGKTQAPVMVVVIFLALLLGSMGLAWWNDRRKRRA